MTTSEVATASRNFHAANQRRSADAAVRDIDIARHALTSDAEMSENERRIAQARVDYPRDSWQQLAVHLGISKDAAAAFRRFRARFTS